MSNKKTAFSEQLLQRRAERLGISIEEARKTDRKRPRFIEAAEEEAQRLGISVSEVLDSEPEQAPDTSYPRPDCLEPFEVEQFVAESELPEDWTNHLKECRTCLVLLRTAKPDGKIPEAIQKLLDEMTSGAATGKPPTETVEKARALVAQAEVAARKNVAGESTAPEVKPHPPEGKGRAKKARGAARKGAGS